MVSKVFFNSGDYEDDNYFVNTIPTITAYEEDNFLGYGAG
jgi:hypothetical protein